MSGRTHGERKLRSPAVNAMSSPSVAVPSMPSPRDEQRGRGRMGPLLRWYYATKYRAFRRERRAADGRRGLVMLQIDALAYADLRRALELGYCPTIARLLREEGYALRRWFCGLQSATPYCQAGIFHGENSGIPAFRFYDKPARRVITCNAPHGVQYIRDRIRAPGALADGSSYVNLLDGDARTVAFTVATRERTSIYRRLGGTRMAILVAMHPVESRAYDLVILSDHGMTPAVSYRVRFGESLGSTVRRIMNGDATRVGRALSNVLASANVDSEYADIGAQIVETV